MQVVEPRSQLLADASVQSAERLVQEQHLRPRRERPCQRHALALAAGELIGVPVTEGSQADQLEQLVHPLALRPLVHTAHGQAERDVLAHGHVPEQRVVLEHEPEPPVLNACFCQLLAGHPHAAGVRLLKAGDHPQHGALPRTAGAEQCRNRPLRRLERDVVHGTERAE